MHRVKFCRLAGKVFGGLDSALAEYGTAVGSVREGDHLILTCKDHIVVSDDRASADCGDTDFFLTAFLTSGAAVTVWELPPPAGSAAG